MRICRVNVPCPVLFLIIPGVLMTPDFVLLVVFYRYVCNKTSVYAPTLFDTIEIYSGLGIRKLSGFFSIVARDSSALITSYGTEAIFADSDFRGRNAANLCTFTIIRTPYPQFRMTVLFEP